MSRHNVTITVANSDDLPSNLHDCHQEKTIQPPREDNKFHCCCTCTGVTLRH